MHVKAIVEVPGAKEGKVRNYIYVAFMMSAASICGGVENDGL